MFPLVRAAPLERRLHPLSVLIQFSGAGITVFNHSFFVIYRFVSKGMSETGRSSRADIDIRQHKVLPDEKAGT